MKGARRPKPKASGEGVTMSFGGLTPVDTAELGGVVGGATSNMNKGRQNNGSTFSSPNMSPRNNKRRSLRSGSGIHASNVIIPPALSGAASAPDAPRFEVTVVKEDESTEGDKIRKALRKAKGKEDEIDFDADLAGLDNSLELMPPSDQTNLLPTPTDQSIVTANNNLNLSPHLPLGRSSDVASVYSDTTVGNVASPTMVMPQTVEITDGDLFMSKMNITKRWWSLMTYTDKTTEATFMCRLYHRQFTSPLCIFIFVLWFTIRALMELDLSRKRDQDLEFMLMTFVAFIAVNMALIGRQAWLLYQMELQYRESADTLRGRGCNPVEHAQVMPMVLLEKPFDRGLARNFEQTVFINLLANVLAVTPLDTFILYRCRDELRCSRTLPLSYALALIMLFMLCCELRMVLTIPLAIAYIVWSPLMRLPGTLIDHYTEEGWSPEFSGSYLMVTVAASLALIVCRGLKEHLKRRRFEQIATVQRAIRDLQQQRSNIQQMLKALLPSFVLERLMNGNQVLDFHDDTSVVVCRLNNFYAWGKGIPMLTVVRALATLHRQLDDLTVKHKVEKIKGTGDTYWAMCSGDNGWSNAAHSSILFASAALDLMDPLNMDVLSGIHGSIGDDREGEIDGTNEVGAQDGDDLDMAFDGGPPNFGEDSDDLLLGGDEMMGGPPGMGMAGLPPMLQMGIGIHTGPAVSTIVGSRNLSYECVSVNNTIAIDLAKRADGRRVLASEATVGAAEKQSGYSPSVATNVVEVPLPGTSRVIRAFFLDRSGETDSPLVDMLEAPTISNFDNMFLLIMSLSAQTLSGGGTTHFMGDGIGVELSKVMQFDQSSVEEQLKMFHQWMLGRLRLGHRLVLLAIVTGIFAVIVVENQQQPDVAFLLLLLGMCFCAASATMTFFGGANQNLQVGLVTFGTIFTCLGTAFLQDSVAGNSLFYIAFTTGMLWPSAAHLERQKVSYGLHTALMLFMVIMSFLFGPAETIEAKFFTVFGLVVPMSVLAAAHQQSSATFFVQYESRMTHVINVVERKRSILCGLVALFLPSHAMVMMLKKFDAMEIAKPHSSILEDEALTMAVRGKEEERKGVDSMLLDILEPSKAVVVVIDLHGVFVDEEMHVPRRLVTYVNEILEQIDTLLTTVSENCVTIPDTNMGIGNRRILDLIESSGDHIVIVGGLTEHTDAEAAAQHLHETTEAAWRFVAELRSLAIDKHNTIIRAALHIGPLAGMIFGSQRMRFNVLGEAMCIAEGMLEQMVVGGIGACEEFVTCLLQSTRAQRRHITAHNELGATAWKVEEFPTEQYTTDICEKIDVMIDQLKKNVPIHLMKPTARVSEGPEHTALALETQTIGASSQLAPDTDFSLQHHSSPSPRRKR